MRSKNAKLGSTVLTDDEVDETDPFDLEAEIRDLILKLANEVEATGKVKAKLWSALHASLQHRLGLAKPRFSPLNPNSAAQSAIRERWRRLVDAFDLVRSDAAQCELVLIWADKVRHTAEFH